jgi:hypothetical protein
VVLAGFRRMLRSVRSMAFGHVRVMACFLVIASFVVFRGHPMMSGGLLVMLSSLLVMCCAFVVWHCDLR